MPIMSFRWPGDGAKGGGLRGPPQGRVLRFAFLCLPTGMGGLNRCAESDCCAGDRHAGDRHHPGDDGAGDQPHEICYTVPKSIRGVNAVS